MYYDGVMHWRYEHSDEQSDALTGEPQITAHIPNNYKWTLDVDKTADELQCSVVIKSIEAVGMPASVFDVPPPTFQRKLVITQFELAASGKKAHVVFGGNTLPFKAAFVAKGGFRGATTRQTRSSNTASFPLNRTRRHFGS